MEIESRLEGLGTFVPCLGLLLGEESSKVRTLVRVRDGFTNSNLGNSVTQVLVIAIMSSTGSGYDLGCNIFSPDGRVFQVEYANKAVESAG